MKTNPELMSDCISKILSSDTRSVSGVLLIYGCDDCLRTVRDWAADAARAGVDADYRPSESFLETINTKRMSVMVPPGSGRSPSEMFGSCAECQKSSLTYLVSMATPYLMVGLLPSASLSVAQLVEPPAVIIHPDLCGAGFFFDGDSISLCDWESLSEQYGEVVLDHIVSMASSYFRVHIPWGRAVGTECRCGHSLGKHRDTGLRGCDAAGCSCEIFRRKMSMN